jgi:hypothetical protein
VLQTSNPSLLIVEIWNDLICSNLSIIGFGIGYHGDFLMCSWWDEHQFSSQNISLQGKIDMVFNMVNNNSKIVHKFSIEPWQNKFDVQGVYMVYAKIVGIMNLTWSTYNCLHYVKFIFLGHAHTFPHVQFFLCWILYSNLWLIKALAPMMWFNFFGLRSYWLTLLLMLANVKHCIKINEP